MGRGRHASCEECRPLSPLPSGLPAPMTGPVVPRFRVRATVWAIVSRAFAQAAPPATAAKPGAWVVVSPFLPRRTLRAVVDGRRVEAGAGRRS